MSRRTGPSFKAEQIALAECAACRGRAVVMGVFYEVACTQCNASGWVSADTGLPLPLEVLVTQLGMRLRVVQGQVNRLIQSPPAGPADYYEQNNRRGAGGTNFTGD